MVAQKRRHSFLSKTISIKKKKKGKTFEASAALKPGTFGSAKGGASVTSSPVDPKGEGSDLGCSGFFFRKTHPVYADFPDITIF